MVIHTLVLLASSFAVAATPLRLVETKKAFAVPMFQPPAGANGVPRRATPRSAPLLADPASSFVCHIAVIKPDPDLDRALAREAAKDIDSRIVRRSICAEQVKD